MADRWEDPLAQYVGSHPSFSDADLLRAKRVYHLHEGKDIAKVKGSLLPLSSRG